MSATIGSAPVTRRTRERARTTRATLLRRVTARAGLLVRRRARRDAGLLLAMTALVALAAFVAVAGPRLVEATLDDATAETVERLGGAADLLVVADVRTPSDDDTRTGTVDPAIFLAIPGRAADQVPAALAEVTADVVVAVDAGDAEVLAPDAAAGQRVRAALLSSGLADDVEVVEGRLPTGTDADGAVEVVAPPATLERLGVGVGDRLELGGADRRVVTVDPETGEEQVTLEPRRAPVVVVGAVRPVDAAAPVWRDLAAPWGPDGEPTLLAGDDGIGPLADALGVTASGTVRTVLDPEAVTLARSGGVLRALEEVRGNPRLVTAGANGARFLTPQVETALAEHVAAVPAARAQMTVPLSGVVGVAALVLVLVSRLLVRRRADAIGLERARGASVPSVVLRLGLEALVLVAVGVAAGVLVADRLLPGGAVPWATVVPVALVALVATPLQGGALARAAWTGRREPANRRERARIARRRDMRRVVAEVGVVLLALGAAWSLRSRGLVGGVAATGGVGDPFLAVAPLLVALAATVVALRAYPWPVRLGAAVGSRSRGVLGVLGAVRARRALEPLPLLALTVGTSVAVTGLLLVDTVRAGQEAASWERVGAEARLEGPSAVEAAEALRGAPGVTAVAVGLTADAATLNLGAYSQPVSVLAVDAAYVDVLAALPDPPADVAAIADLAAGGAGEGGSGGADGAQPSAAARVPVVVDPALAERIDRDELRLTLRGSLVPLLVVGATDHAPLGEAPGPFVFADLDAVLAHLDDEVAPDTVWAVGPGAEAAAADVAADLGLPAEGVHLRAAWAAERRAMALVAGVERVMLVATGAVGLLAVLALAATVVSGARERGRTLSLLRTLGMRPRLGWWLALAELTPVVLTAVVAGGAAAALVVLLLGGALGLDVLVGGVGVPTVTVAPDLLGWVGTGAVGLLLAAAFVEVAVHRRDRLSEVLRVGETTT